MDITLDENNFENLGAFLTEPIKSYGMKGFSDIKLLLAKNNNSY